MSPPRRRTPQHPARRRVPKQGAGAPSLRLDDQLCFALYTASRTVTAFYRPLLEALGLTYPQYLVLLVLWGRGDSLVKDLGAALDLDSGTLSPLLKRLEAAGLIRRERRADDERSVAISLTAAGAALRLRCERIPALVAGAMGLDAKGLARLRGDIRRLGAAVEAAGQHPSSPGLRNLARSPKSLATPPPIR